MNKILATIGLFLFLTVITSCVKVTESDDSVVSTVRYELKCRMTGPNAGGEYLVDWNSSRAYYMSSDGSNWVLREYSDRSYTPRQGEACKAYETSNPTR